MKKRSPHLINNYINYWWLLGLFGAKGLGKVSKDHYQTVFALATLAGGLAGGLASGDTAGAVTGGQSGKNTSENNDQFGFSPGMMSSGQAAFTLGEYMTEHGATPEQISAAQSDLARGLGTGAPQPATEFVKAWALFMSGVGGAVIAPTAGTAAVIGGGALGGITDATKQAITINFKPEEKYSYTDTLIAIGTGAVTQGKGLIFSGAVNSGGAYFGSRLKGEDATGAVTGAVVGTLIGYKGGEKITEKIISHGVSPVSAEVIGTVSGGVVGTAIGTGVESGLKKDDSKK